jgi:hypothetical protein
VTGQPIAADNLVLISDIVVIDRAVATNTELNPTRNTLINTAATASSSGGGAFTWFGLCVLVALRVKRSLKIS